VLNHPAGGIGFGGEGLFVALFCQQGGLKLSEGLGSAVVVIGFQLLSQLADSGGELLGSMPSCQSEPERCSEQDGPEAWGRDGERCAAGAVRTAMGW
jgi:hypothetical protein